MHEFTVQVETIQFRGGEKDIVFWHFLIVAGSKSEAEKLCRIGLADCPGSRSIAYSAPVRAFPRFM